jgi:hypothetical protein
MWHKLFVGYGLFILSGVYSGALIRGVFTKAIPLIRLVRDGQQAKGKVVRLQLPIQKGYRTPRPVIEFIGQDGQHVRYQDLHADKGLEKPGDVVTVRYDPANPKEMATIRGMSMARSYLRGILIMAAIFAGIAVIGLLILLNVIPFNP